MNARKIAIVALTIVLIVAVFTGAVSALGGNAAPVVRPQLANVRDFNAVASQADSYAVDGGVLFKGQPGAWTQIQTPEQVIVSAVAVDSTDPNVVYIGAANEMAIYRTLDNGHSWLRVPLADGFIGGVTDIAVDGMQRIIYVGTDTAGLFRLRDVGSSMILSGHTMMDEPVIEVAADSSGTGMVFARTQSDLYRAESYGLNWALVTNLGSAPTALAIADSEPATVYVGTSDRGLVKSTDGVDWTMANEGLGFVPGSRLQVDALAVDPQQPQVVYVATSYLYGTSELHQSPVGVAMSTDGAQNWATLYTDHNVAVAGLMPVSGETGAVYVVSNVSRTPQPLGTAPAAPSSLADVVVDTPATSLPWTSIVAWAVAALAALALVYAVVNDLRSRNPLAGRPLANSVVRNR
jgi:photosystem II stability/assembly factor-like uncharacterized protein